MTCSFTSLAWAKATPPAFSVLRVLYAFSFSIEPVCHSAANARTNRIGAPLGEDDLRLHQADAAGTDALDDAAHGDELVAAVEQLHPVALFAGEVTQQHRLTVEKPPLLLGVGGHLGEWQWHGVEGDPRRLDGIACLEAPRELADGEGVGDVEAAHGQAAQAGEVRSRPDALAQLVGEAARVGARGTGEAEGDLSVGQPAHELEAVDRDLLWLERHLTAPARQLAGTYSVDLLGAVRRRRLLVGAFERRHRRAHGVLGEAVDGPFGGDVARGVVGVGAGAEAHRAFVDLGRLDEETGEARRLAQRQHQETGGVGVERAGVADLLLADDAAHLLHRVVRGPPP